jgi:uncharacterized membrane protein YgcG
MNLKNMLVAGTATVAGVAGGVAVYQITAPADVESNTAAPAVATPKARAAKGETRFAPCRPPSVLEGGKCVTTAVQTVTVPAPAAAAAPAAAPAPAPVAPAPVAPASQPAGHPAAHSDDDDDSDCRKLRQGDYDNAQERSDLEADCAEDQAEDRDDRDDDDHSGSGSSGSGSSGSGSSGSGSSGSGSSGSGSSGSDD